MRPKFKEILKPYEQNDEVIVINNGVQKVTLSNVDKVTQKIIELLDGKHSETDILKKLDLKKSELESAIQILNHYKMLEDEEVYEQIPHSKRERYKSNLRFFSNYTDLNYHGADILEKLESTKVFSIGLGGMAITLANLAGMGLGMISGLDFDDVELGNLSRQFLFSESVIGKKKHESTEKQLKSINSEIQTSFFEKKIENEKDLLDKELQLEKYDIILNGIDEPAILSTRNVNFASVRLKIPFLQSGVIKNATVLQFFNPNTSACYDCFLINNLINNENFEKLLRINYGSNADNQNVSFAPYISVMSGLMAGEIFDYLIFNKDKSSFSSIFRVSPFTLEDSSEIPKFPNCPTCNGSKDYLTSLDELIGIAKEYKDEHRI